MKRVAFILGIMFVAIIALLESGGSKKRINLIPDNELKYDDDVWWDN